MDHFRMVSKFVKKPPPLALRGHELSSCLHSLQLVLVLGLGECGKAGWGPIVGP